MVNERPLAGSQMKSLQFSKDVVEMGSKQQLCRYTRTQHTHTHRNMLCSTASVTVLCVFTVTHGLVFLFSLDYILCIYIYIYMCSLELLNWSTNELFVIVVSLILDSETLFSCVL